MVFTCYEDILNFIKEWIKDKDSICISIDGMCGSGKTTFAHLLQKELDANLVHIDHFYLPKEKRKSDWFETIGGNIDFTRFERTVFLPFTNKEDIDYVQFNPCKQNFKNNLHIPYKPILIVDGSYSQHIYLQHYYQLKICMKCSKEKQFTRLSKREGKNMENFLSTWIPKENTYFDTMHIFDDADILLDTTHLF